MNMKYLRFFFFYAVSLTVLACYKKSADQNVSAVKISTGAHTEQTFETPVKLCTVTFDMNGLAGEIPALQTIESGSTAEQPQIYPLFKQEADGTVSVPYWSMDAEGMRRYCFSEPVQTNLTLYAHFGAPRIFDVQGHAHESPLQSKKVKDIRGIVTAITYSKGKPNGFYFQDKTGDGDAVTSDAVYVFCGTEHFPSNIAVKDYAAVTGTVQEFAYKPKKTPAEYLSVTQLIPTEIHIISSGNELPAPVELQAASLEKPVFLDDLCTLNPEAEAIDFYESLEGMRVCVKTPQVVAAPYKGTQYIAPADAHGFSARGGIVYNSYDATARLCLYPKKCFAGSREAVTAEIEPSIGDVYGGDVIGVLDYAYGNYQIALTEPLPALIRKAVKKSPTAAGFAPDKLNLASYNLENFSRANTAQSHSSKKTGAERAAAFARHFVLNMNTPDLICLAEIQDDSGEKSGDGVVSAHNTLRLLIDEIAKYQTACVYKAVCVNPENGKDGGAPGANIRCAYLYRSDRLELVPDRDGDFSNTRSTTKAEIETGGTRLLQNPARIGVGEPAFKSTRKPLVAHFRFKAGINGGKDFFVINNHLNSKRSDGKIWGSPQPVHRSSETKRHKQAEIITAFIRSITDIRPEAVIISAGDYNDFWFSETVAIFKNAGMKNIIETLPENNRYTYIYDGLSQTLDNILVTDNVRIDTADVLHLNAEMPPRDRLSDHDPLLCSLSW